MCTCVLFTYVHLQVSSLARTRSAVRADLRAEARERRAHAFGRSIPVGDPAYWRPPRNRTGTSTSTRQRWRPRHEPRELASMEETFGDIAGLK